MSLLESFKKLGNYFGAYKVHLCPEVKGQVSENGQPLINAKIERRLRFSDGKYVEDFAYTDDKGGFSFPEVNIRSNQPAVPFAEIFTSQSLLLTHKSKEYCLWGARLPGFSFREEYAKKLGQLVADISSDKIIFKFENTKVEGHKFEAVSIGRWNKDFEILKQSDYFDLSEIKED